MSEVDNKWRQIFVAIEWNRINWPTYIGMNKFQRSSCGLLSTFMWLFSLLSFYTISQMGNLLICSFLSIPSTICKLSIFPMISFLYVPIFYSKDMLNLSTFEYYIWRYELVYPEWLSCAVFECYFPLLMS